MTFATTLALLVGLLVAAPLLAHLLRRGRTQLFDFPPARLVPSAVVTSDQRRRVEDRVLLLLRALMVVALAVLGATPFVRCSKLNVDRQSGASVAMALVIDDSQSMRARVDDGARFMLAKEGAEQLLGSAREGDVVAVVLAGQPARIALGATTNLSDARSVVSGLKLTDRGTDLSNAVSLARSVLKELPHVDKRVVVLSDLASEPLPAGEPKAWTPLETLSEHAPNCGIAFAEQHGRSIAVTVGCNDAAAAEDRRVELRVAAESGEPLASEPLLRAAGSQKVNIQYAGLGFELAVRLSGTDRIAEDNEAFVTQETMEQLVAVVADAARASVMTGGATVVEQALVALNPEIKVRPLAGVPETPEDLNRFAALIVDDPPGLSPAARSALAEWLNRGGVAFGLLGPAATSAQLAMTLEPFARTGAQWEQQHRVALDEKSLSWLGAEHASLREIDARGRVRLDAADLEGTQVVGKWEDGSPWLFRRESGRGVVFTAGLPASIEWSDLALRPAFLALLDEVLEAARQRTGASQSSAGTPWLFPAGSRVSATGPGGKLTAKTNPTAGADTSLTPERAGRYEVHVDGKREWRFVVLDVAELVQLPLDAQALERSSSAAALDHHVDASPSWAFFVLVLFALELLFRALRSRRAQILAKP